MNEEIIMVEVTCDRKYMKTDTDYNSCVYDLEADFDDLPSNISLPDNNDISKLLNRTLPATRKCFFKLTTDRNFDIGVLNFKPKFKIFTEKVQDNITVNDLINVNNCTITDNNITGTLKDNSTAETPLLSIHLLSMLKYTGSEKLTIEVYDENGTITQTINTPKTDLLENIDTTNITTPQAYLKFIFKQHQYLTQITTYTIEEEIITTTNNKQTQQKTTPNITTHYQIQINGNNIKTKNSTNTTKKHHHQIHTNITTHYQISINNTNTTIKKKKKIE